MISHASRRIIQRTMTAGIAGFTSANASWLGLYNNGTQGEILLLRDLRIMPASAVIAWSQYVQGLNGGSVVAPTFALDVSAPALAGQLIGAHPVAAPTAGGAGLRVYGTTSAGEAPCWPWERPIAAILPGYTYMVFSTLVGITLNLTMEWLVTYAGELG